MTKQDQAMEACRRLVAAYKNGLNCDGSIDWSDVDDAHVMARKAIRKSPRRKSKNPDRLWDSPDDFKHRANLIELAPRMAVLLEWFSRAACINTAGMRWYACGEARMAEAKKIIAELKGVQ